MRKSSPVECVAWDIQRRTATARTAMASAIWRWRRSSSGGAAVNLSAEVMAANQKEEERAVFLLRMIRGLSQGDAGFGFTARCGFPPPERSYGPAAARASRVSAAPRI